MEKYQGIIFDLDGVICHTDRYHYLAWKALTDRLGICFNEKINNRLRGVSRMESLEIILSNSGRVYTDTEKDKLANEKNENYRRSLTQMTPENLSPEVKDTLDFLRKSGCRLAIGSSSKNAGFILERIGLNGYFDAVVDGNQISHAKPDPEVFQCAARRLGLAPENCLVVEDALVGIEAAVRAGCDAAGMGDAQKSSLAKYHLAAFSELKEVCG